MSGDLATRIGDLLAANGCDCECDHHPDEHDDDCERCLACRIGMELDEAETPAAGVSEVTGGRAA